MSLLEFLGISPNDRLPSTPLGIAIQRELADLAPDRIERIAAYAGLLVRVAHADAEVSEDERNKLVEIIREHTALTAKEASALAALVIRQATELEGIEYALLTRAFNSFASTEEKQRLIDCLYAVATADDEVSVVEDDVIHAVARALLLSHEQFIRIRQRYKEKLELLRPLKKPDV